MLQPHVPLEAARVSHSFDPALATGLLKPLQISEGMVLLVVHPAHRAMFRTKEKEEIRAYFDGSASCFRIVHGF
jgi:hypothetical protein